MKLVDSHCHLTHKRLRRDVAEVVAKARQRGVSHMLSVCVSLADVAELRTVCAAHPDAVVGYTAGVHPHYAHDCFEEFGGSVEGLRQRIVAHVEEGGERCMAVGECGLDTYRNLSPLSEQRAVLEAQLLAAADTARPVVIHTRGCDEATVEVLRAFYGPGVQRTGPVGIIHCFTGAAAIAEQCVAMGFHVSFSGAVTLPHMFAPAVRDDVLRRVVPNDRFLLETDAPFIMPDTYRGMAKRCEPFMTTRTAEAVARIKGLTQAQAIAHSTANFKTLFNIE